MVYVFVEDMYIIEMRNVDWFKGFCEEYKSYDINFRLGNWVFC